MNDLIIQRIKETRLERGYTQQELATFLGKTAAAISELERGKVQVSANDLHQISKFLGKPIEYFYGEEFIGDDVQSMIAVIRRMEPEARKEQVRIMMAILEMQKDQDILVKLNVTDIEEARPHIENVYKNLITFLLLITSMKNQALTGKKELEELLGLKEDEIPKIE